MSVDLNHVRDVVWAAANSHGCTTTPDEPCDHRNHHPRDHDKYHHFLDVLGIGGPDADEAPASSTDPAGENADEEIAA